MKKQYALLAILILGTLPCAAQTLTLYDNFDHRYINPALWNTVCGTSELSQECVIELQDEHLRLARRVTGDPGSNTGLQYGQATAFFFNPMPIKGITTDMVVRRIDEQPCAANPSFGSHGDIIARFFNAGNGTESDDVGAFLSIGRAASDPKGQLTVIASYFHNGDYSHNLWLGTVPVGTPVTVTVRWDQANHRFLYSWTDKTTNVMTSGVWPYPFSDTTPAADPEKHLDVELFPSNCTAVQTWQYAETLFSNVYIEQ
jgi:hypothetical protein